MVEREKARRLHDDLEFIGLRAQATSAGLIQLCAELLRAGVLDDAAISRIKDAVQWDISVSNPRAHARPEFQQTLRKRLDAIFPSANNSARTPVGNVEDMQTALSSDNDPAR